jgi:hypothetical protein
LVLRVQAIWIARVILGNHSHFGPFAVKQGTEQRVFSFSFFFNEKQEK